VPILFTRRFRSPHHGCADELELLLAKLGYTVEWVGEGENRRCRIEPPVAASGYCFLGWFWQEPFKALRKLFNKSRSWGIPYSRCRNRMQTFWSDLRRHYIGRGTGLRSGDLGLLELGLLQPSPRMPCREWDL